MKRQKHLLAWFVFVCLASPILAQISVSPRSPAQAFSVVQDSFLAPSGVMPGSVQNATFNGVPGSLAVFSGTSNIGIANGIILGTDNSNLIPNPASAQLEGPPYFGLYTDPQLQAIASGTVQDAAVLEFDFQPLTDTLKFRYVFASEEYPEYVCSPFNDVFGFFISGPNPSGGNYVNYNFALIPDSTIPVSINSVNPGIPGANAGGGNCSSANQSLAYSSLYTANSGTTIIFDGFTHVLTVVVPVMICGTYHIKLAVANMNDEVYNSAVFLEAHSFGGPYVPVYAFGGTTIGQDSTLICIGDTVTLCAANAVQYNWGVSGTSQCIQVNQPGVYHCFINDAAFTCFQISENHYVINNPNCFAGLTEINNNDFLTISPNPFKEEVRIHSKETFLNETVVSVLSVTGVELKKIEIKQTCNDFKLSLKELAEGIYFLRISNLEQTITKKIIRQ